MIGSGAATPGWSTHDQAMALLKVATNPQATEKRLKELHDATHAHDEARKIHEKASKDHDAKWAKLMQKEGEIHAREENLKVQIQAHQHDKDGTAEGHARTEVLFQKREKELHDGQAKLAQDIQEFSHYREREKEALKRQHAELDKRAVNLEGATALLQRDRQAHDERMAKLAAFRDELTQKLQHS